MNKQPAIVKIISTDYIALLAVLFPIMFWGVYLLLLVWKHYQAVGLFYPAIAAVVTVVSILVFIWRIRLFFRIFADGLEARATVSNVSFFRDRGRLDYVYTHQGQKYASGNMVHKVKKAVALKVGDEVIVILDRNNPKRAYIRDLYL